MAETSEKQPVTKRLTLVFPVDGAHVFTTGGPDANCESITPRPDGGYEIVRGSQLRIVSSTRVDHYFQDPRPGYDQEQIDKERELPSYAEALPDSTFLCRTCNHVAKSIHALKVHHGKRHPVQPD